MGEYVGRLSRLLGITDMDLHIEEVTGADKSLDVVVDIFNRVNSGGTKLSKGDLALAKICAEWPEAREADEGQAQGVGEGGLPLQPRLAAALGEHGADGRGEVPASCTRRAPTEVQDGARRGPPSTSTPA